MIINWIEYLDGKLMDRTTIETLFYDSEGNAIDIRANTLVF